MSFPFFGFILIYFKYFNDFIKEILPDFILPSNSGASYMISITKKGLLCQTNFWQYIVFKILRILEIILDRGE